MGADVSHFALVTMTQPQTGIADGPRSVPADRAVLPGQAESSDLDGRLRAWIGAIVEQDQHALAALYDATHARVYGLALRIVRRADLAEEVVEDTYFQVWRQAVRFDATRGAAHAWLLGMARSRAIDLLRSESRHRHDEWQEAWEPHDASGGVDELLQLARQHADLHRALLLLDAQPRQLVSLAFFRGYTHEEIAAHAQLPLGTVKSQIRRALLLLRDVLADRRRLTQDPV
jgi:RNA polymerase sigma factor (sigma-70 family)